MAKGISNTSRMIEFFVPGIPAPSGSKRGFYNKKLGRTFVVENNPDKMKDWRNAVRGRAFECKPATLIQEPVFLSVRFIMPRLKSHFGSGRNQGILKPTAPNFHKVKPDGLKLLRNTEDGLTGIILLDDSLIVRHFCQKQYGNPTGAYIRIDVLSDDVERFDSVQEVLDLTTSEKETKFLHSGYNPMSSLYPKKKESK